MSCQYKKEGQERRVSPFPCPFQPLETPNRATNRFEEAFVSATTVSLLSLCVGPVGQV